MKIRKNMLGDYGEGIDKLYRRRGFPLSFLDSRWEDVNLWKKSARGKFIELAAFPEGKRNPPPITYGKTYNYDGLEIQELSWQMPYGPGTEAIYMKPAGARGPLPGILALHDHGAFKFFGKEKISQKSDNPHPLMKENRDIYYGGAAWANEIAKRGYGVLISDAFLFGSRKVRAADLPAVTVKRMMMAPMDKEEITPEELKDGYSAEQWDPPEEVKPENADSDTVLKYNAFAAAHEDIVAKSLFCAGLTWPGVFLQDDLTALDILSSMPEVDPERIGCGGLSGGGLRTNYIAGLDDRIRCSVTVGFMTTWRDFLVSNSYTHTWMVYIPLLSRYMDYPDILSMRAPSPTMVLATDEDPLYDVEEVKISLERLRGVYKKAGKPDAFASAIYPGPHKFDLPMQEEAFRWFDRWLK